MSVEFKKIKIGRSCAVWSFAVVHEVKNSDASTDVNDPIEDVNDFLVTASAAATVNSLDLSSAEIADREIKIWKTCTFPFPKDKNPLDEWRRSAVHCYLGWVCWRGVYWIFLQLQQLPSACFQQRVM